MRGQRHAQAGARSAGIAGLVLATDERRAAALVACAQAAYTMGVPCRLYVGVGPATTQMLVATALGAEIVVVRPKLLHGLPNLDAVAWAVEDAVQALIQEGWHAWH